MKVEENVGSVSLGYYVRGKLTRFDGTEEEIEGMVVGFNENGAPQVIHTLNGHLMEIAPPPPLRCDAYDMLVSLQSPMKPAARGGAIGEWREELDELPAKSPDPSEEAENG